MNPVSRATPSLDERIPLRIDSQFLQRLYGPVQFVSFWSAIALPFLYAPLLVGGLPEDRMGLFAILLLANAVAFVAGHGYGQE